ncbi:MAG: hypothetical protein CMN30_13520 [Sandaracinus sp.]|nr:hypothetical protein [Sandaracinus sp.]
MDAAQHIEDELSHADQIELRARLQVDGDPWWFRLWLAEPHVRQWNAGPVRPTGPEFTTRAGHFRNESLTEILAQVREDLAPTLEPGTVEVSVKNGRSTGTKLRGVALEALCTAWGSPTPDAATLKASRAQFRETKKAEKAARAMAKAKAAAETAKVKQRLQKASRPDEKVTDLPSFLKGVESRADRSKLKKALKMLKADRFELFDDVKETEVLGVVKSQNDPSLRYACRLTAGGVYSCCTQNLNVCGGLRGSMCKHLLVLVIGLVKAGQLDPVKADQWIEKTIAIKPELDKDVMSEVFLRYQGAEAGEVDWRPTETVPEDFYAF